MNKFDPTEIDVKLKCNAKVLKTVPASYSKQICWFLHQLVND